MSSLPITSRIMRPTRCQLRYCRLASEVASASASFKGKRLRAVFGRVLSASGGALRSYACPSRARCVRGGKRGQVYAGRTGAFWGCAPEPVRSRRGVARRKAGDRRRGCVATSGVLLCGLLQLVQWGPCCRCRALRNAEQHFASQAFAGGCQVAAHAPWCGFAVSGARPGLEPGSLG